MGRSTTAVLRRFIALHFLALTFLALAAPTRAAESVLYRFQGEADGANPFGALVRDAQGALYGTTFNGGASNFGTVFKLSRPTAPGTGWTKRTLYSFAAGTDGRNPYSTLVIDSAGALFGTTYNGGAASYGTVFKLTPPVPPATAWTRTILHNFTGGADGSHPHSGLVFDPGSGALYGTAEGGGASFAGVVYKLTPSSTTCGGPVAWSHSVIHAFGGSAAGTTPYATPILDGAGAIYGTTYYGGASGFGSIYRLTPPVAPSTVWTKTVLYSFPGNAGGANPFSGLIRDSRGSLYGTTQNGGASGYGTIFKLSPPVPPSTVWTRTTIRSFGLPPDGASPYAGLVLDSSNGALYGVTQWGGATGNGSVYRLTPPVPPATAWSKSTLHSFGRIPDGSSPYASVLIDDNGLLYGTTYSGGTGAGVIYQIR
jgi:uncharacterized repeat protein (TIGR03803 family)